MKWNDIIEKGRLHGPIPPGGQRVMVIECDAKITHHDFSNLKQAREYADDAASETCDYPPLAIVLNDEFRVVYRGRPFYTRSNDKSAPNTPLPDQQECCDNMIWRIVADLGHVAGVDLDLGRCKRCGTNVMAIFSYFHGTPVYITVNPADAERFISLLGSLHELKAALKEWLER